VIKFFRSVLIGTSLLTVAACQTTLSPGAVSKIQAAGYQQVNTVPSLIGPVSGISVYACPASRCGSVSAISVNIINGNSNALGETLEAQVRKPGQSQAKIQNDFAREFNTSSGSRKVSSVRVYATQSHAGVLVSGIGKTPRGNTVHFAGRVAFRANTGTTVIGFGATPAEARKAVSLANED
jgi:hypothetical protein